MLNHAQQAARHGIVPLPKIPTLAWLAKVASCISQPEPVGLGLQAPLSAEQLLGKGFQVGVGCGKEGKRLYYYSSAQLGGKWTRQLPVFVKALRRLPREFWRVGGGCCGGMKGWGRRG